MASKSLNYLSIIYLSEHMQGICTLLIKQKVSKGVKMAKIILKNKVGSLILMTIKIRNLKGLRQQSICVR